MKNRVKALTAKVAIFKWPIPLADSANRGIGYCFLVELAIFQYIRFIRGIDNCSPKLARGIGHFKMVTFVCLSSIFFFFFFEASKGIFHSIDLNPSCNVQKESWELYNIFLQFLYKLLQLQAGTKREDNKDAALSRECFLLYSNSLVNA